MLTEQSGVKRSEEMRSRRVPSQARAKTTHSQILKATDRLLRKVGFETITTNLIASKAKISTGSLYQYFPNKEAVFFALYEDHLVQFRAIMDGFNQEPFLSLPRDEFFDRLLRAMNEAESHLGLSVELEKTVAAFPSLISLNNKHAELVSDQLAFFLRYFGSKWPIEELRKLSLFAVYENFGTRQYRHHVGIDRKNTLEWEITVYNAIFELCFEPE